MNGVGKSEFPVGMTGEDVLKKLELVGHPTIKKLHAFGLAFTAHASEQVAEATAFAWLNAEGETVGDIHLDNRTVQGAKGKMELEFLKTAVLWGAQQVLSMVKGDGPADTDDAPEGLHQSFLNPNKAKQAKEQFENPEILTHTLDGEYDMAPYFPMDQLNTASTVKLSSATKMYQPVQGTSNSSRYFVVGISNDVKVAARLKGKSVSIRLEGPALGSPKFDNVLKSIGFTGGKAGEYSSMHVEAPDPITAQKAIGSVLSALPVQWKTPMP